MEKVDFALILSDINELIVEKICSKMCDKWDDENGCTLDHYNCENCEYYNGYDYPIVCIFKNCDKLCPLLKKFAEIIW